MSVAVSGTTAIIGAPDANAQTGAAYIYTQSASGWTQQAKLIASDGAPQDFFGLSVALTNTTALIGAPGKNSDAGSAYVFARAGTTWTQQTNLANIALPAASWRFGYSVALTNSIAVVSTPGVSNNSGTIYIFTRAGAAWNEQGNVATSDSAPGDFAGASLAISGTVVVVGAPFKNGRAGAAYVFTRTPGIGWHELTKLVSDRPTSGDRFGAAVAISGSTALVGAPGPINVIMPPIHEIGVPFTIFDPFSRRR